MKYFKNITTPKELKKQFRALSIKLHPDRPTGNAEEFSPFSNYSGTGRPRSYLYDIFASLNLSLGCGCSAG